MGNDDSLKPGRVTPSIQPEVAEADDGWDDEVLVDQDRQTVVAVDDHDAHDRITAVPDLPTEQYVAQVMRQAEHVERAAGPAVPRVEPECTLELDELDLGLDDDLDVSSTAEKLPLRGTSQPVSVPPDSQMPDSVVARTGGSPRSDMQYCYAMGDFSGALSIATRLLELDPSDTEATRYAESCRAVLTEMYAARLGPPQRVVAACVAPEQVRWLSLDHRAGFVLSLVDGTCTVEELLDISGMAPLDTLKILVELLEQGVISVADR